MNQHTRIKAREDLPAVTQRRGSASQDEAADLRSGKDRELLLNRAEQAEKASRIDAWLSSSGLRPPK